MAFAGARTAVPSGLRVQPSVPLQTRRQCRLWRKYGGHGALLRNPGGHHRQSMVTSSSDGSTVDQVAQEPAMSKQDNDRIGVLFVCLGNICRSPTAEAVFQATVEKAGLQEKFEIDSCGTGGGNPDWYLEGGWSYHEGDPADPRMTHAAKERGIRLTSRSRPLKPEDLLRFDYIICMDPQNMQDVQTASEHWSAKHSIPTDYRDRLKLMTAYSNKFKGRQEVPDPYFGGSKGFELVLDLLQDSCEGLLMGIRQQMGV